MRNYDPFKAPTEFKLVDLLRKFDKTFGATKSAEKGKYGRVEGNRTLKPTSPSAGRIAGTSC